MFFWGEFFNLYGIYINGIWIFFLRDTSLVAIVLVVLEGEERVSSTFCNVVSLFPNMFEVEGLSVPLLYCGWDSVHGVNPSHDLGGDSS